MSDKIVVSDQIALEAQVEELQLRLHGAEESLDEARETLAKRSDARRQGIKFLISTNALASVALTSAGAGFVEGMIVPALACAAIYYFFCFFAAANR